MIFHFSVQTLSDCTTQQQPASFHLTCVDTAIRNWSIVSSAVTTMNSYLAVKVLHSEPQTLLDCMYYILLSTKHLGFIWEAGWTAGIHSMGDWSRQMHHQLEAITKILNYHDPARAVKLARRGSKQLTTRDGWHGDHLIKHLQWSLESWMETKDQSIIS